MIGLQEGSSVVIAASGLGREVGTPRVAGTGVTKFKSIKDVTNRLPTQWPAPAEA